MFGISSYLGHVSHFEAFLFDKRNKQLRKGDAHHRGQCDVDVIAVFTQQLVQEIFSWVLTNSCPNTERTLFLTQPPAIRHSSGGRSGLVVLRSFVHSSNKVQSRSSCGVSWMFKVPPESGGTTRGFLGGVRSARLRRVDIPRTKSTRDVR